MGEGFRGHTLPEALESGARPEQEPTVTHPIPDVLQTRTSDAPLIPEGLNWLPEEEAIRLAATEEGQLLGERLALLSPDEREDLLRRTERLLVHALMMRSVREGKRRLVRAYHGLTGDHRLIMVGRALLRMQDSVFPA